MEWFFSSQVKFYIFIRKILIYTLYLFALLFLQDKTFILILLFMIFTLLLPIFNIPFTPADIIFPTYFMNIYNSGSHSSILWLECISANISSWQTLSCHLSVKSNIFSPLNYFGKAQTRESLWAPNQLFTHWTHYFIFHINYNVPISPTRVYCGLG